MSKKITYAAMDTHKKQHRIAVLATDTGETIEMTIANSHKEITKMVKKIKKLSDSPVHFCYEAGVCGFDLKRKIEKLGCQCTVIAPSLIPIKPGDRVKTDRRDAKKLLELFKAGLLTEVHAPALEHEAARELTRLRYAARENLQRARHQLLKFLTRHGYIFKEGRHWTLKHMLWLKNLNIENSMLNTVFDELFDNVVQCQNRLDSIDKQVHQLAESEPYKETVSLLRCFKGIDTLTAICIITEIFNFGRFQSASHLMSYLGLTPSENSSGDNQKRGPITKAGNKRVRRLLNESAWHYRHRYNPGKTLEKRRQGQPQWAIDIADKAGQRLHQRHRDLINKGKMPSKTNIAVARELAGFVWALFKQYELQKCQNQNAA